MCKGVKENQINNKTQAEIIKQYNKLYFERYGVVV